MSAAASNSPTEIQFDADPGAYVLPTGKYRGRMLIDLSPGEVESCIDELSKLYVNSFSMFDEREAYGSRSGALQTMLEVKKAQQAFEQFVRRHSHPGAYVVEMDCPFKGLPLEHAHGIDVYLGQKENDSRARERELSPEFVELKTRLREYREFEKRRERPWRKKFK